MPGQARPLACTSGQRRGFKQMAAWLGERVEVVHLFSSCLECLPWLNDGVHMANLLGLNELEAEDSGIALAQLAYLEGPLA